MKALKLRIAIGILLALGLAGCETQTVHSNKLRSDEEEAVPRPLVDDKYRLSADRQELEEMRKEIPPDQQRKNDEVAFLMKLLNDNPEREPSKIREDFDRAIRKKRELVSKNFNKEREEFTKNERKTRDEFLKNQAKSRKDFLGGKHTKSEREEFFNDQDEKRREYFAAQREKRNDFEADMNERRRNFEDYAREKSNEFNAELRSYTKRYDEAKKAKAAAAAAGTPMPDPYGFSGAGLSGGDNSAPSSTGMTPAQEAFLKEFEALQSKPGSNLESGQ
jgi:hypothetical protein